MRNMHSNAFIDRVYGDVATGASVLSWIDVLTPADSVPSRSVYTARSTEYMITRDRS